MTNTLSAPDAIRNVERYLAQQYAKREVETAVPERSRRSLVEGPADGVVVILAWCVMVLMIWK